MKTLLFIVALLMVAALIPAPAFSQATSANPASFPYWYNQGASKTYTKSTIDTVWASGILLGPYVESFILIDYNDSTNSTIADVYVDAYNSYSSSWAATPVITDSLSVTGGSDAGATSNLYTKKLTVHQGTTNNNSYGYRTKLRLRISWRNVTQTSYTTAKKFVATAYFQ